MKFESTWVRVKNERDCAYCGRKKGARCVSKFGRELIGRVHMDRQL